LNLHKLQITKAAVVVIIVLVEIRIHRTYLPFHHMPSYFTIIALYCYYY